MRSLFALLLASTWAVSASAATQTPGDTSDSQLLEAEAEVAAGDQRAGFSWTPSFGFNPMRLPAQDAEPFVGLVGAPLPGAGYAWHPEFGLISTADGEDANPAENAIDWSDSGNSVRAVLWSDAYLEILVDQMAPPDGLTVTEVIDVSPDGKILGKAETADGTSVFFTWAQAGPMTIVQPADGAQMVGMSRLATSGHAVGQVATGDEQPLMAALVAPDGSVAPLPGPGGAGSVANGVNSAGVVVGASTSEPPTALIWGPDGQPMVLETMMSAPLPDGFKLLGADDINDAGEIVATALSPSGAIHAIKLTPDAQAPGQYKPRPIGELFPQGGPRPTQPMSLSNAGAIAGECAFGARDCPTGDMSFANLDTNITNFGGSGLGGQPGTFLPLVTGKGLSASGRGFGQPGAGLGGDSPFDRSRPDFGSPNFPTLTSTSTDDNAGPLPTPLPAAGALLLFSVILLRWPAGLVSYVRKAVDRTL